MNPIPPANYYSKPRARLAALPSDDRIGELSVVLECVNAVIAEAASEPLPPAAMDSLMEVREMILTARQQVGQ